MSLTVTYPPYYGYWPDFPDRIPAAPSEKTLSGSSRADFLTGSVENDFIDGRGGDDWLMGGKGLDTLLGGHGNDILGGGASRDVIKAGPGNDTILLSLGMDRIHGGRGVDTLDASHAKGGIMVNVMYLDLFERRMPADSVTLSDGTFQMIYGVENLIGTRFADTFQTQATGAQLLGAGGDDTVWAWGEQITVRGGKGHDFVRISGKLSQAFGGWGNDEIIATGSASTVFGRRGDDILSFSFNAGSVPGDLPTVIRGGAGNDRLIWLGVDSSPDYGPARMKVFGGAGADIFDFGSYKSGTIQDFEPGIDKVDIHRHLEEQENVSFADLKAMITDTVHGAVLSLDFETIKGFDFVFKGVMADDFIDGDFIF